jgi:hypothetical protein
MRDRRLGLMAAAALMLGTVGANAFDESKYPDLKGQWDRTGRPRWPVGQAPLTDEYRAVFEANLADQAAGGQGSDPTFTCLSPGMPRVMNMYEPMEIVITPWTTHLLMQHIHDARRIFTDGRDWPESRGKQVEPTFAGYSIGRWVDDDGDGRYDALVVETRHLKGPRTYDSTGIPFHQDNKTVVKERIHLDKADPRTLYDDITVIDNALTRPWTVTKKYARSAEKHPVWEESVCAENNRHVVIGTESYFLGAGGQLMPVRKDQPPPDLRYFNARK